MAETRTTTLDEESGLRRSITGKQLFFYTLGDVLGSGIYVLIGLVAAAVGGAFWIAFAVGVTFCDETPPGPREVRRAADRLLGGRTPRELLDEDPALAPLREAAHLLAAKDDWPALYDPAGLASCTTPANW